MGSGDNTALLLESDNDEVTQEMASVVTTSVGKTFRRTLDGFVEDKTVVEKPWVPSAAVAARVNRITFISDFQFSCCEM